MNLLLLVEFLIVHSIMRYLIQQNSNKHLLTNQTRGRSAIPIMFCKNKKPQSSQLVVSLQRKG